MLSPDAHAKASLPGGRFDTAAKGLVTPLGQTRRFFRSLDAYTWRNVASADRGFRPGSRIANCAGIPGTLGCFALTIDERRPVFLTSHHVVFGAGAREQEPVWILQGREGRSGRCIGHSRHGRCGIVRDGEADLFMDCATVEVDEQIVPREWRVIGKDTSAAPSMAPGDHVTKNGAATGVTHGVIEQMGFAGYARVGGHNREVVGQILVRPLARGGEFMANGDSGAALRNRDGLVVGLLWGADARGYGLACPIAPVLRVLHVRLARFQLTGVS